MSLESVAPPIQNVALSWSCAGNITLLTTAVDHRLVLSLLTLMFQRRKLSSMLIVSSTVALPPLQPNCRRTLIDPAVAVAVGGSVGRHPASSVLAVQSGTPPLSLPVIGSAQTGWPEGG